MLIVAENIVKDVWRFLDSSPHITRMIQNGFINTRALAKHIIKEKKFNASLDAVISAIRRYELTKYDDVFGAAHKILYQTVNISTRSKLAVLSLQKEADIQRKLPELFAMIQYIRGDVLRISQANESIKLVFDMKNLDNVLALFPKSKIINVECDVAEINMLLHPKMQTTPGILAITSTELAINGINIVESVNCPPEMLMYVKENDLLKAYNVIHQLCTAKKK